LRYYFIHPQSVGRNELFERERERKRGRERERKKTGAPKKKKKRWRQENPRTALTIWGLRRGGRGREKKKERGGERS
jgi:hypothetical protein